MNVEYSRSYFVSAADAAPNGTLSITALTQRIIEIATEHANSLGIGNPDMADSRGGWVLVRLAVELTAYPRVNTTYRLTTWIESWNRMFSSRCFAVETEDGDLLGYTRTTWMVINLDTHDNLGLSHLSLPAGAVSGRECPIAGQSRHQPSQQLDGQYTVRYSDLDCYRHVNTLKWIEIILDRYTLADFDTNHIARFEIGFAAEGHYDYTIDIYRTPLADSELSAQWRLMHADTTLVTASVIFVQA